MKHIILIKQHNCIQLGHLYEHLYCNEIKQLMFGHGLFKYVDYMMYGNTYDNNGVIEIDLKLFSDSALKIEDRIINRKTNLNEDTVNTAFMQIIAEENAPLIPSSKKSVTKELSKLDKTKWQLSDIANHINLEKIELSDEPLILDTNSSIELHKIITKVSINNSYITKNKQSTPLFHIIFQSLLHNTQDKLSLEYRGYINKVSFGKNSVTFEMLVYSGKNRLKLQKILKSQVEFIKYQLDHSFINKIRNNINQDTKKIMTNFDILNITDISSTDLKNIVRTADINEIINNSMIEIKVGTNKISSPLGL